MATTNSQLQQLPSTTTVMPVCRKEKTQINSRLSVDWTISESTFDFDGRWIIIDDVEIGHVHFHLNTVMERIQVWVLGSRAWEEQVFRQSGITRCDQDQGADTHVHKMIRNPHFVNVILNAKSCQ